MKKYLFAVPFVFLAACAPVSKTVSNVSNFVAGVLVASYQVTSSELAAALVNITPSVQFSGGYTPLFVESQSEERVVVEAKALKGAINANLSAEDFSVEMSLVTMNTYTELTLRPSSASNDTARSVAESYVTLLDKRFERYKPE
jgi:hypothetical protein